MNLDDFNLDSPDETLPEDLAKARGDLVEAEEDDEPAAPAKPAAKAEATPAEGDDPDDDKKPEADEDDPEAEGEETEEERLEREAQEAEEAKKKRIRVPKARLDEESAKRRKAEEELEKLRAQLAAQARAQEEAAKPKGPTMGELEKELEDLEEKYEDAVINGEKETARKLRSQIAKARDTIIESRVTVKAEAARSAALEQVQFDNFLDRTLAAYPELDRSSEQYDSTSEADVMDIAEAFLAKGQSRVDTIGKAVKLVLGAKKAAELEPEPKTEKKTLSRKVVDTEKQAAVKQPPSLKPVGDSGDKQPSLHALPEDQFNKLSEAELRAARGDDI
mgnify:CR=1 FL=1